MNAQNRQKSIVAFAVVLIVALFAATGFAQDSQTDASLKFVGTVEAVSANSVVVNGHEIFFDNAAINTDLTVGASVMIEASLSSDNRIEATRIDLADADFLLPDELRITGVLDASGDSSFDFGGSLLDAETLDASAALSEGAVVRVFANADASGEWSARRVQLLDATSANVTANADLAADFDLFTQGRYQLVGTLDAVTEDSVTVSGMTINTTGAEIRGGLVLGALANVWLSSDESSLRAEAVTNADLDAGADTGAFIDLSDDTGTDTSANVGVGASVEANTGISSDSSADASANADTDTSVGVDADSDSAEAGVGLDINLGGGLKISLGGG